MMCLAEMTFINRPQINWIGILRTVQMDVVCSGLWSEPFTSVFFVDTALWSAPFTRLFCVLH
jgi:hypothetical protein